MYHDDFPPLWDENGKPIDVSLGPWGWLLAVGWLVIIGTAIAFVPFV